MNKEEIRRERDREMGGGEEECGGGEGGLPPWVATCQIRPKLLVTLEAKTKLIHGI